MDRLMSPPGKKEAGASTAGDDRDTRTSDKRSCCSLDSETDVDVRHDALRKSQRQAKLYWNQMFLCGTIILAWVFGVLGFSIAWILLIVILVHFAWWGSLAGLVEDSVEFEKRQLHRRRALARDETAEWANIILNRWWIFSSSSTFSWLKANVDPVLHELKPQWLESVILKSLSFGDATPFVNTIKVFDASGRETHLPSVFMNGAGSSESKPFTAADKAEVIHSLKYRLIVEADVGIISPEFKMVFCGKLLPGIQFEIVVDDLKVLGKVQLSIQFSMDAPFPHISKATVMFLEKPEVKFNVRLLKPVKATDTLGVLIEFVHTLVMKTLTGSMVDPYKVELNLSPPDTFSPSPNPGNSQAHGVLTVSVEWIPNDRQATNEERWCRLWVGNQKYETGRFSASSRWRESHSFLVEHLQDEKLIIKVKGKRYGTSCNLAEFFQSLETVNKDGNDETQTKLHQKKGIAISLALKYSKLPPALIEGGDAVDGPMRGLSQVDSGAPVSSGVMYLLIHGADGLSSSGLPNLPNPYCVVFCNSKKIKTTHYVSDTSNPRWDSSIEFLVMDSLQTSVSIAVCSWDMAKMAEAGFLGLTTINLKPNSSNQISLPIKRQSLPLDLNADGTSNQRHNSTITVTCTFRPVESVGQPGSILHDDSMTSLQDEEDNVSISSAKSKGINPLMTSAKHFLSNSGEISRSLIDIPSTLAAGHGLMEMFIIRARNLQAKDLNGFSDPFCEIRINQETQGKTAIKKRTLNPVWDEKVTIRSPRDGDTLSVLVWDHDTFGKDFLGTVTLTLDDIHRQAAKDSSEWFCLDNTKTGEIELKLRIVSEGLEGCESFVPSPCDRTASSSRAPTFDTFRSIGKYNGNHCSTSNGDLAMAAGPRLTPPDGGNPVPDLPPKVRNQPQGSPCLSGYKTLPPGSKLLNPDSPQLSTKSDVSHSSSMMFGGKIPANSSYSSLTDNSSPKGQSSSFRKNSPHQKSKMPTKVPTPVPPVRGVSLPLSSSPSDSPVAGGPLDHNGDTGATSNPVCSSNSNKSTPATSPITRGSSAYSSLHEMKRKMRKTFSHPLRRFRSEANVNEDKLKTFRDRVTVERRDDTHASCNNIDSINDDLDAAPTRGETSKSQDLTSLKIFTKKSLYYNVQGTVVQATGLDLPRTSQISCRVQLHPGSAKDHSSKAPPRTLAKTRSIQASPNPAFNLDFQADVSGGIPASFMLAFEIRTTRKDVVAAKTISLQELFEDVLEEGDEMRTCLSMNSGATLEVRLSHGKESEANDTSQRKVSRLLRSWSVHRIGKI